MVVNCNGAGKVPTYIIIFHDTQFNFLLLFADDNLSNKAKGNHHLSELQKALIVDFISQNNFGDACFDEQQNEMTKLSAWTKIWDYATKECGILENSNPCKNVSVLKETLRKWRYAITARINLRKKSGEGAVQPLSDNDERYKILLDGVKGIATGKEVYICPLLIQLATVSA